MIELAKWKVIIVSDRSDSICKREGRRN